MMNDNFLLDTNIVIGIINRDPQIQHCVRDVKRIFIPSIVLGELYYGAYRSSKLDQNLSAIARFLTDASVVNVDDATALVYGRLKQQLSLAGTAIPANDLWIAATALQHDATIISADRHFSVIPELVRIAP